MLACQLVVQPAVRCQPQQSCDFFKQEILGMLGFSVLTSVLILQLHYVHNVLGEQYLGQLTRHIHSWKTAKGIRKTLVRSWEANANVQNSNFLSILSKYFRSSNSPRVRIVGGTRSRREENAKLTDEQVSLDASQARVDADFCF